MAKKRLLKDQHNKVKCKKIQLRVHEKTVKSTERQLKVPEKTVKSTKRQLHVPEKTVKGKKRQLKVPEKTVKGKKRQLKDTQNTVKCKKGQLKVPERTLRCKKRQLKDPQNTIKGTKRQLKVPEKTVKGKKIQLKDTQNTVKCKKGQLKVPERTLRCKKRQLKDPQNTVKGTKRQLKIPEKTVKGTKRQLKVSEKTVNGKKRQLKDPQNTVQGTKRQLIDPKKIVKGKKGQLNVPENTVKGRKRHMKNPAKTVEVKERQLKNQEKTIKRKKRQLKDPEMPPIKKLKKGHNDNLSKAATKSLNTDELEASRNSSFSDSTSSSSVSMMKPPVFLKEIDHKSSIRGSIILPNQQLLVTDMFNKVKLIDTKRGTIVSELKLPYMVWDITQTKPDEFAIACHNNEKIQFVSLSSDTLFLGREMQFAGRSFGMVYNDLQNNLIVTNNADPPGVEIRSLTGTVIKRLENDVTGNRLFTSPDYVALSPDKTMIYVNDCFENSVTLMTLNGEVKAVYKDKTLLFPKGICVDRSGIVYVVGYSSHTVHQIMPGSDKLEPLLDRMNGLKNPFTISYCDIEDKLYVGQDGFNGLKIFKKRM